MERLCWIGDEIREAGATLFNNEYFMNKTAVILIYNTHIPKQRAI